MRKLKICYFINSKDLNDILDSHIRIDTVSLVIGCMAWYNLYDKNALARWCAIFLSKEIGEAKLEDYANGKSAGKHEEKIEIAQKMLEENIDISIIASVTNLSIDEINNLK